MEIFDQIAQGLCLELGKSNGNDVGRLISEGIVTCNFIANGVVYKPIVKMDVEDLKELLGVTRLYSIKADD